MGFGVRGLGLGVSASCCGSGLGIMSLLQNNLARIITGFCKALSVYWLSGLLE